MPQRLGVLATAHARAGEGVIEPSHFPAAVRLAVRLQETSGARNELPLPLDQVLEQGLKVMDATAISLCMDNHLPIVVFSLRTAGNIKRDGV